MNPKERVLRYAVVAGLLTSCNISGPEPKPTATPTKTPTPIPLETPTPEPEVEKQDFVREILYPALQNAVSERREAKQGSERVDWELSNNRINFLLMGIGSEGVLTDSIHLISLDLKENNLDVLTFNRDIEAPEVQRFSGKEVPYRINAAHVLGGFRLTEMVLEDATGLSVDFQTVMNMDVLPELVKNVLGNKLEVCLPWEIDDPIGYFPAGGQILSGEDVLKVTRARKYASNYERNQIQQIVIKGILTEIRDRLNQDPITTAKTLTQLLIFLETQQFQGNIKTNFDVGFFLGLGREVIAKLWEQRGASGFVFDLPNFDKRFVFGPQSGLIITTDDPEDPYRQAVRGGDSQASNLIFGYWATIREKSANVFLGIGEAGGVPPQEICPS